MVTCLDEVDPHAQLPMAEIAGITEWDLVYALFWLAGTPEPARLHFPALLQERYFAYSRFLLLRITGEAVPPPLATAVARFQTRADAPVDRDFRDKLTLLESVDDEAGREALIARIERYWPRRRNAGFCRTSAPLHAGHDASNDLAVDNQLACILRVLGVARAQSAHAWRW